MYMYVLVGLHVRAPMYVSTLAPPAHANHVCTLKVQVSVTVAQYTVIERLLGAHSLVRTNLHVVSGSLSKLGIIRTGRTEVTLITLHTV